MVVSGFLYSSATNRKKVRLDRTVKTLSYCFILVMVYLTLSAAQNILQPILVSITSNLSLILALYYINV
jgi:hypothetical protein